MWLATCVASYQKPRFWVFFGYLYVWPKDQLKHSMFGKYVMQALVVLCNMCCIHVMALMQALCAKVQVCVMCKNVCYVALVACTKTTFFFGVCAICDHIGPTTLHKITVIFGCFWQSCPRGHLGRPKQPSLFGVFEQSYDLYKVSVKKPWKNWCFFLTWIISDHHVSIVLIMHSMDSRPQGPDLWLDSTETGPPEWGIALKHPPRRRSCWHTFLLMYIAWIFGPSGQMYGWIPLRSPSWKKELLT